MGDRAGLLDLVYEAAIEPALWPTVLERFGDLIGAEAANMSRLHLTSGDGAAIVARVDPAVLTDYFSYFAQRNPLLAVDDMPEYLAGWAPRVLTDEDSMPREDFVRSEYFNDFMKPIRSDWLMMIRLSLNGPEIASMAFGRGDRRGRFDADELAVAARMQPHLIRAYRLGRKLAVSGRVGPDPGGSLDHPSQAVLMLDGDGRVRHANAAADRLFRADRRLRLQGGRLVAADVHDGPLLAHLIAQAASRDPDVRQGGSMGLGAPGVPPLSVTVAPLRPDALSVLVDGPAVLVVIDGLERLVAQGDGGAPRLTPRERDCLGLVAQGKSDWEISVILGVSEATARFHTDNGRKKLGAVNRAQAVAKLAAAGLL